MKRLGKIRFNLKIMLNKVIRVKRMYKIPFLIRLKMNLKGFTSDQYIRYDLKNNDTNNYISEFERWKTRRVNGRYNIIMDDKIVFAEVFSKYVDIPKNVAWIKGGHIYNFSNDKLSFEQFLDLLVQYKTLVLKPVILGGAGKGIHVMEAKDKEIFIDYQAIEKSDMLKLLKALDDYIIVEFIKQHAYANKLYDKTTNTIRMITIKNIDGEGYSIPNAVHRIGVQDSIPVDNASKGALISEIDLQTGIMGQAKTYFDQTLFKYHPDSGNAIEGVKIPHWEMAKEKLLDTVNKLPYIKFMAWDIVITEKGFQVVEINASTGLDLFQIWKGERNSDLGSFYQHYGFIK